MAKKEAFNADAKATEREQTPATIGGVEFFPVRLTNPVIRKVRAEAKKVRPVVEQAKVNARLEAQKAEKEGATPEELAEIREEAENSDEVQDASYGSLISQISVLLRDGDGKNPGTKFLEDNLDTRDAGLLIGWLMRDGDGGNSLITTGAEMTTT